MTPAPYTPATVTRIRTLAPVKSAPDIADDLNWDLPRLRSVARKHEIELINPSPTAAPSVRPDATPAAAPEKPVFHKAPKLSIDMRVPAMIDMLPMRQAQVLEIIFRYYERVPGQFISGTIIINEIGTRHLSLPAIVRCLDLAMTSTRWRVEGRKGSTGGYRLMVRVP